MVGYFDSSVMVSLLVNDAFVEKATVLWEEFDERHSSILLAAESVTAVRRIFRHQGRSLGPGWLESCEADLQDMLKEVTLQNVDETIVRTLVDDPRLADCRSLDALHLATAVFLQSRSAEPLVLCTFDQEMAAVAEEVGLQVRR